MPLPTFLIGPYWGALRLARTLDQQRRRVKLTAHRAYKPYAAISQDDPFREISGDVYCITVTNASRGQDMVVTDIWFDTDPHVAVLDNHLPVRLRPSDVWETNVPVTDLKVPAAEALWLARCLLIPGDKIVKSKPRKNVPPVGTVGTALPVAGEGSFRPPSASR
jgi:hypothetical protein